MDLKELFQLKYDLLDKLEEKEFASAAEKEAFRRGYEEALNAFFKDGLALVLGPDTEKKAS